MPKPDPQTAKPEPDFYYSFERTSGLRYSDILTRDQYNQMMKRIEDQHGG